MIRSRMVLAVAVMLAAVENSQPVSPAIAEEVKTPYRVGFLAQPASCKPAWIRKNPVEQGEHRQAEGPRLHGDPGGCGLDAAGR